MFRKLFMLIASVVLIGIVAATAVGVASDFAAIDLGDPASHFTTVTPKYTLTVEVEGGGSVEGADGEIEKGTEVKLTAIPQEGYAFQGFETQNGEYLTAETEYSFIINRNTYVIAIFVPIEQ